MLIFQKFSFVFEIPKYWRAATRLISAADGVRQLKSFGKIKKKVLDHVFVYVQRGVPGGMLREDGVLGDLCRPTKTKGLAKSDSEKYASCMRPNAPGM